MRRSLQLCGIPFGANFDGKELFEALEEVTPGLGSYNMLRIWEVEMMIKLGETEEVYSNRSTRQRAILISAIKIPEIIKNLSEERAYKDAKH